MILYQGEIYDNIEHRCQEQPKEETGGEIQVIRFLVDNQRVSKSIGYKYIQNQH